MVQKHHNGPQVYNATMKRQQSDTPPTNVYQWTKGKCEEFLRTIEEAKLSGSKSELISRVKGYVEHPEI